MFEDLSGAGLAAGVAGVDVASLDADAALGYALAAARLAGWVAAAEGAGLAHLKQTYPAFEPAVGGEVHRLDTDRLVIHEVRAAPTAAPRWRPRPRSASRSSCATFPPSRQPSQRE